MKFKNETIGIYSIDTLHITREVLCNTHLIILQIPPHAGIIILAQIFRWVNESAAVVSWRCQYLKLWRLSLLHALYIRMIRWVNFKATSLAVLWQPSFQIALNVLMVFWCRLIFWCLSVVYFTEGIRNIYFRADSMFVLPNQWETPLQSNAVSHWLGASLESALYLYWKFAR